MHPTDVWAGVMTPLKLLQAFLVVVVVVAQAGAQGFAVGEQSARAMSMGNATVANTVGPEAAFYNPAGLPGVGRPELAFGGYFVAFDTSFVGVDGRSDEQTEESWIPHFAAVVPLNDRVALGGFFGNTYGLAVDWSSGGPLSAVVDRADLSVLSGVLAVGIRATSDLSLGLGLALHHGRLERTARPRLPDGSSGFVRLDVDGFEPGFSVGALYALSPRQALGVSFQSPFSIELSGPGTLSDASGAVLGSGDVELSLDLPAVLTVGYSFRPTGCWTLNADVTARYWRNLDTVALESPDPVLSSIPAERFDYETGVAFQFGAEYWICEWLAFRAGYVFSRRVGPESTFSPLVPDLDASVFSGGFGLDFDGVRVDLAVQYVDRYRRVISSSVNSPDGVYEDDTLAAMVTVTLGF